MEKNISQQTRQINLIYKEILKCNETIKTGELAISTKQEKEKILENLMVDLIKQNKIQWKSISFEEWYLSDYNKFWIYSTENEIRMGVFHGLDELNENENRHFDQFKEDYFYYGYPFYYDVDEKTDTTDREKAFKNGTVLSCINRKDL